MPLLVAMIQTTWPAIRVALYKRTDGHFQYVEEGLQPGDEGEEVRVEYSQSGLYSDFEVAKAAMIEFYVEQVEDGYVVDRESVTVLEPPDFKGS
jgi:hypothetical protein